MWTGMNPQRSADSNSLRSTLQKLETSKCWFESSILDSGVNDGRKVSSNTSCGSTKQLGALRSKDRAYLVRGRARAPVVCGLQVARNHLPERSGGLAGSGPVRPGAELGARHM